MKKKILGILLAGIIAISLTGCGNNNNAKSGSSNNSNNFNNSSANDSSNKNVTFKNIKFGETVKNEQIEFTLDDFDIAEKELPYPGGGYSSIADVDEESYIYLLGHIKNISNEPITVLGCKIEIIFDDKYSYNGEIWSNKSSFGRSAIDKFEIFSSVPDDVIKNYKTVEFRIAYYNDINKSILENDFSLYENRYSIILNK